VGCDGIIVWWGHVSTNGGVTGKMCCAFPLDEITAWRAHPIDSNCEEETGYFQVISSIDLRAFKRLTFDTPNPAAIAQACASMADQRIEKRLSL